MYEVEKPQGFMTWLKESVTIKLIFIAGLIIALLIPSFMIQNLIGEREARRGEVDQDIADTWSGTQLIQGPVLVIPYKKQIKEKTDGKESVKEVIDNVYILPNALHYNAAVSAEKLHRGIFETSSVQYQG